MIKDQSPHPRCLHLHQLSSPPTLWVWRPETSFLTFFLSVSPYICISDLLPFHLCAVSPSTYCDSPTCSLAHHFLLLSTYSFSTICHSLLSLGKLQLSYVLNLYPHPSLPLLLFVFSHQASLCAAVSLVFLPMSPLLSFTSLVCLLIYVYNPWRSHTERKVAFVVYAQVCLLTLPPLPLSPLFPWRLVSSFSFSPLFQRPRAPGKRERVIWWVYVL